MEAPRQSLAQQRIPDYWNDYRQSPDYTWGHTTNPRFANETDWILESKLKGYDVPITMSANELGKIQAQHGKVGLKASFAQAEDVSAAIKDELAAKAKE